VEEVQFTRQLFGIDAPSAIQEQVLDADQMERLAELDRSLQQITDFAFDVLGELKLEPADFAPVSDVLAIQNATLTHYQSELQGDRPIDRTIIYALLRSHGVTGNLSQVDDLFFRILLLRRALETKKQFLRVKIDNQIVPIQEEEYLGKFAQFLESKKQSGIDSDRIWGTHLITLFGDLLQKDRPTAGEPPMNTDEELPQIAQKLETDQKARPLTLAEQIAAALVYVKLQRYEEAVTMLNAMELTSSTDLLEREWIIATLARKWVKPGSPLMQRGSEAADHLLQFRLSERDSLRLVSVLEFFGRNEEAQKILDQLVMTASDRRLLADLLRKLISSEKHPQENAAKIARRILTHPAFLQNAQRLTTEVLLLEDAVKTLREQNQMEPITPLLENRLCGHRDKTDSQILLARLYLLLDRQDEAKALALELSQNPTSEPERRQMIVSLLTHFGLYKELESMNRLLLERTSGR
jgi:tetratricopeptide (TPR) repeat protein